MAAKSVLEQYENATYSKFVEHPSNAPYYQEYYHHSFLNKLIPQLNHPSTQRVLDLATGNGILLRKIRRIRPDLEVTGVDLSPAMLQEAETLNRREDITCELILSDVCELDESIGPYDIITSGFFLVHVTNKLMLDSVMKKVYDLLTPGGYTIHIIPQIETDAAVAEGSTVQALLPLLHEDGSIENIELYDHYWSRQTYTDSMKKAGLEDVVYEEGELSEHGKTIGLNVHAKVFILSGRKPKF